MSALVFIIRTLFDLYLVTFAMRLLMQRSRSNSWNPLAQFILKVTNPVVLPLRRFVPSVGRVDTATLLALVGLQALFMTLLLQLACSGDVGLGAILLSTLGGLINLLLRVLFWSLLIYVLLSWTGQGGRNPASELLGGIVEPLLAPVRRLIPPIGGLDLSALFVGIGLEAVRLLLPPELGPGGLLCGTAGLFL